MDIEVYDLSIGKLVADIKAAVFDVMAFIVSLFLLQPTLKCRDRAFENHNNANTTYNSL
jgi:hypothetical protein